MACPTCDHMMQGVGYGIFHCQRCGTMINPGGSVTMPALVTRLREFERQWIGNDEYPPLTKEWRTAGFAESINVPSARTQRS